MDKMKWQMVLKISRVHNNEADDTSRRQAQHPAH
jgi:hypothetical protein